MAIMADDGTLAVLQTVDLANYLSSVEGDTEIDMMDGEACLGQRAAAFVLTDANGIAPYVEFTAYSGKVKGKDSQYYFEASNAAGDFISQMINRQNWSEDSKPFAVYMLRLELDWYTDRLIRDKGWEAAL